MYQKDPDVSLDTKRKKIVRERELFIYVCVFRESPLRNPFVSTLKRKTGITKIGV